MRPHLAAFAEKFGLITLCPSQIDQPYPPSQHGSGVSETKNGLPGNFPRFAPEARASIRPCALQPGRFSGGWLEPQLQPQTPPTSARKDQTGGTLTSEDQKPRSKGS